MNMNINKNDKLNPNWVTGFVDAEGCFNIYVGKRKNRKLEWYTQACFQVALHIKDRELLLQIKGFFGNVGTILESKDRNMVYYKVRNLDDIIQIIVPHFDKYPLISQKQSDFLLFKNIVELMYKDEHLTKYGMIKIVGLKASLNRGLSDKLKACFPEVIKVERSRSDLIIDIDYNWIAGFFTGEGCFFINISKSKTHKLGYTLMLQINVSQHIKDKLLMNNLISILGCGKIHERIHRKMIDLRISKFQDIYTKIIPILNEHKIKGIKSLDFEDFCRAAELVNKGSHLTLEGLEKIRKIKSGMNTNRIYICK